MARPVRKELPVTSGLQRSTRAAYGQSELDAGRCRREYRYPCDGL